MRKAIIGTVVATAVIAVGGVAVAATVQLRATATGAQEVPPAVDSAARADLKVKVSSDRREVRYDLKVTEPITNVFMAHLHRGPVGANGPIAVWLYPHPAPSPLPTPADAIPGEFDGRLAKDTIVPADLCWTPAAPYCSAGTPQWDAYLRDLQGGQLYVNLHTAARPGGEIRSQVHHHPDNG